MNPGGGSLVPRDYKKKVEAFVHAQARSKAAPDDQDVYKSGRMEIGVPLGCWIWLGALAILVVYGMSRC